MGTTYTIQIADKDISAAELVGIRQQVDAILVEVNRQMSTYIPDSEISVLNKSKAGHPVRVSAGFMTVFRVSADLARLTGGAFDPTVGPLVNLWGFGTDGRRLDAPSHEHIHDARRVVGFSHLSTPSESTIQKDVPEVQLDFGAVAKGYGVDAVAQVLSNYGLTDFLVEIGGETIAYGLNAEGNPWRVGIQRPHFNALPGDAIQGIVHLSKGMAIATSGDYQNFFRDASGRMFSHIIDPRSAQPVNHAVASVSVLAHSCLLADGLATALYVMGPDQGIQLLEASYPQAEALFVLRKEDGTFTELSSKGFEQFTGYKGLSVSTD